MSDLLGLLIDVISGALLIAGAGFYLIGAIGLNRMPDVFSRMHAASVSETLGLGLLLLGMLLQAGVSLVAVKLIFIFAILFLTAPIATHALSRAALHDGEKPLLADEEGRLVPTDPGDLFPELDRRLVTPLTSEQVAVAELDPATERAEREEDRPSNS